MTEPREIDLKTALRMKGYDNPECSTCLYCSPEFDYCLLENNSTMSDGICGRYCTIFDMLDDLAHASRGGEK